MVAIVLIWTLDLQCHRLCLSVILLCYRIACLGFCNKRFCNKNKGHYLCRTLYVWFSDSLWNPAYLSVPSVLFEFLLQGWIIFITLKSASSQKLYTQTCLHTRVYTRSFSLWHVSLVSDSSTLWKPCPLSIAGCSAAPLHSLPHWGRGQHSATPTRCFLLSSALTLVSLPKMLQEREEECRRLFQSHSEFVARIP